MLQNELPLLKREIDTDVQSFQDFDGIQLILALGGMEKCRDRDFNPPSHVPNEDQNIIAHRLQNPRVRLELRSWSELLRVYSKTCKRIPPRANGLTVR